MASLQLGFITGELERNASVFLHLLGDTEPEVYLWKPAPEQWCMLEVVCHLLDEEREDFRARAMHIIEYPGEPMPPIDPASWVHDRHYAAQPFHETLSLFVEERTRSVNWLRSLDEKLLTLPFSHPRLGEVNPGMFISSWLAHDLLHIRQLSRLRYLYLNQYSAFPVSYAGNW